MRVGECIETVADWTEAIDTAVTGLKSIYEGEDIYIVSVVAITFVMVTVRLA